VNARGVQLEAGRGRGSCCVQSLRVGVILVVMGAGVIGFAQVEPRAIANVTPGGVPVPVVTPATPGVSPDGKPAAGVAATAEPTPVGIEGRHILRVTGTRAGSVMLAPVGERPSMLVRIASAQREGDAMLYDLRYVGRRAGEFDLREALQYVDGSGLSDVEPAKVAIKSVIPDDHDLLMVELASKTPSMTPLYTLGLLAAAVLWLVPLVVLLARWIARLRANRPGVVTPPVSLWDLLRPLLEKAARGELTVQERARLEMLALGAWIERLGLKHERHTTVMEKLRAHPGASAAVDVLNGWLHAREPDVSGLREQLHLLAPPGMRAAGSSSAGAGSVAASAGATVVGAGVSSGGAA